jgi:hypothetical protein
MILFQPLETGKAKAYCMHAGKVAWSVTGEEREIARAADHANNSGAIGSKQLWVAFQATYQA